VRRQWRQLPLPLAAAVLLAVASVLPAAPAQTPAQHYQALVDKLAAPEMEGRGPGTKGIVLARDLIVGRFRALGLRPAFGGSYTQEFQVPGGVTVEKQELAVLAASKPPGEAMPLKPGSDFAAMGFSAAGAFEGEAVFVGYSIVDKARKHDSYAAAPAAAMKSKVAVVLRYEPHDANGVSLWTKRRGSWSRAAGLAYKVNRAARRGAAAVLIVNPPAHDTGVGAPRRTSFGRKASVPVVHISRETWRKVLRAAGRDSAAAERALRESADAGKGKVTPLGVTLRGQVALRSVRQAVHNVAGVLPGSGALAEQYVVVGAHYDHLGYGHFGSRSRSSKPTIHPGADDNASGTAGVITLAQRLAGPAAPPPAEGAPVARRSVLFVAFAGEEMGLVGSRHLVGHLSELGIRREQIVAMLNMDMIGRLRNRRLGVWGVDSGDRLREIVAAAAEGSKLTLTLSGPGLGPSDHASFYRAKVPVLCFNTGMHGDLHAPSDTPDKIDAAGAIEVLGLVEGVLAALRAEPEALAYAPPKKGARRAYLGIAFDADFGGPGCRINTVMPDSPASRAGLRGGDVIVKWNGKGVRSPADLMVLIRHCSPDAAVKLSVRRGGKDVEATVKLGGR